MDRISNRKHLNMAIRGAIIGAHKAGSSNGAISRSLNISKGTVARWVDRFNNENHIDRRPQPGQPKKLDIQTSIDVVQKITDNPFLNAGIVAREYEVTNDTIRKIWKENGIFHGIAAKKPSLNPQQRQARLNFAIANINRDWSNVVFSDEKTFQTDRHQKLHVYRPRNCRYVERYTQPNQRSGRLTAGIWGWISIDGPGEMCFVTRRLNRFDYVDILEEVYIPSLEICYPDQDMIFMQDNCSVHTAGHVKDFFGQHPEIEVLQNWPANSPDFNPIENYWAEITRDWRGIFPRTRENLENTIIQNWEAMRGKTEYFQHLYESMPRRLQECINNQGGPTSY